MTTRKSYRQFGFTLTEVIIVVAISSIIILVLLELFDRHDDLYRYEQAQLAVTEGSRLSMTELNTFISQGYRIVSSRVVDGNTYTTGTTTMVVQIPSISSAGAVLANTWDYAIFTLNGEKLTEIIDADALSHRVDITRQVADTVSNLTFTYDNNDLNLARKVNVDMTTSEQAGQQTVSNSVDQDIYLLNYN